MRRPSDDATPSLPTDLHHAAVFHQDGHRPLRSSQALHAGHRLRVGFDIVFDELAAPIEQKTNAPWLKKYNENGKEVIRKMDWDYEKETGSWPLATPADLETGVFCKTWDEYNKVTNRAA